MESFFKSMDEDLKTIYCLFAGFLDLCLDSAFFGWFLFVA